MQASKDTTGSQAPTVVARYTYKDPRGRVVYEVRRLEPGHGGEKKSFLQYRKTKQGWRKGISGLPKYPYRLPELIAGVRAGKRVFLVEGEKDADRLAALGYVVSCTRGAPSVFLKEWLPWFDGCVGVVIISDNDANQAGHKNAQRAFDLLRGAGVPAKVFTCAHGKDVSDHLDAGGKMKGRGQFKEITTAIKAMRDAGSNGNGSSGAVSRSAEVEVCVEWALNRLFQDPPDGAVHNGRAAVAFEFAQQLRDVPREVAEAAMRMFWCMCPQTDSEGALSAYSWEDAHATLRSALENVPSDWTPGVFAGGALDEEEWERLLLSFGDIEEKPVGWLWKWRFPYGKVSVLEGDPDLGKSLITLDLAARVTRGKRMPDQTVNQGRRRDVLMIAGEDDPEDTQVPRLRAAGADLSRVHTMLLRKDAAGNAVPLAFPGDARRLRHAIEKLEVGLVVIDPIMGYLDETINSHNDASVRRALAPLQQIAAETGCCILMVRHLNKSGDMRKAKYRGGGSIAFTGAARSVFVVEKHPSEKDTVVMAKVKMNLAPSDIRSWAYEVHSSDASDEDSPPRITWTGEVMIGADELLAGPDDRKQSPARDEAVEFLKDYLSDGPALLSEIQKVARKLGLSDSTLRRAREGMPDLKTRRVRDDQGKLSDSEWRIEA